MLQRKLLEKQAKLKTSKKMEIIKRRTDINEKETKKPYKESMKQKDGSLRKTNKIDKPLQI
jgi:hypothetical protein